MNKELVNMLATLILKRAFETEAGDLVVMVSDLRAHLGQVAVNLNFGTSFEFNKDVNEEIIRRTQRVAA